METKTIAQYVVAGIVVAGSLFLAYNAQDKITDQASEIKVLQNQIAALNDKATENEELVNKNKALEAEVAPLTDEALRARTDAFRAELAAGGEWRPGDHRGPALAGAARRAAGQGPQGGPLARAHHPHPVALFAGLAGVAG